MSSNPNKNNLEARKLRGFQDISGTHAKRRWFAKSLMYDEATACGFEYIETPILEYSESLLGVGGETDKQVFKFLDNGGRDVCLRFDLTVPFARYMAENDKKLPMPYKRLQIGEVFRAEKPQKGRFRQFGQMDLDVIGVDSPLAEIETISCAIRVLLKIVPGSFTVSIGSRPILGYLVEKYFGSSCAEKSIMQVIDKLDMLGPDGVAKLLPELGGKSEDSEALIQDLTAGSRTLESLLTVPAIQPQTERALFTLKQLNGIFKDDSVKFVCDLSIARGLHYYSGIVFETKLDDNPTVGSICSGGAYTGLVSRFGKEDMPAIGVSIGLDRLLSVLPFFKDEEFLKKDSLYIGIFNEKLAPYALSLAHHLRRHGIKVEMSLAPGKIANQVKKAVKLECSGFIAIGETEETEKTFSIKWLDTGKSVPYTLSEILAPHFEVVSRRND